MNDPIIQSNVNIDFKPAFDKPNASESLTNPQVSSQKKKIPERRFRPHRDPNLDSSKYVAHRYADQNTSPISIAP